MPYLERLYLLVDQWQGVASRDYSLAEGCGKIKDTIVRWRRIELASWKGLLAAEERRHREEISSWWFDIYEVVIYNFRLQTASDSSDQFIKVIAALNDFVTAGDLGDYNERLRLIFSFAVHAHFESQKYPALERISQLCHHLYRLYCLYRPEVQKSLQEQRTVLEKEIAETVQLASWRDTSVFALTESAKRSHRRLYKTIRKFRGLLSQPVTPILQRGITLDLRKAVVPLSDMMVLSSSSTDNHVIQQSITFCREENIWASQSRLFLDPLKLSSSIQKVFDQLNTLRSDVPISVNEFVDVIEDLRNQTPATLTDENGRQVKFLKTQKRRVFAQTMKTLREWGIASKAGHQNVSTNTDSRRISSTLVWKLSTEGSTQSPIDETFYRIIDLLPRIRAAAPERSSDLSESEFRRALGYVESLVDGLFEQRNILLHFEDVVASLKEKLSETIGLLSKQVDSTDNICFVVSSSAKELVTSRRDVLRRFQAVVAACILVLESHKQLDMEADIARPVGHLNTLQEQCHALLVQVNKISHNDYVVFSDALQCCHEIDEWFDRIWKEVLEIATENPVFDYALKPVSEVISWAKEIERLSPTIIKQDIPDTMASQQLAESLGAFILINLQQLSGLINKSSSDAVNFPKMMKLSKAVVEQLRPSMVMEKIIALHESSLPLLSTHRGLQFVAAVYNSLLPVLEEYTNGCEQLRHYLARYHEAYSQMTHVLMISFHTLVTKGYCSPQQSETDATSLKGDGFGLGEGEGETDISNEIKDDENLDDLADQGKTESKESKLDGDQDGVDMEDDFEGALEDAPQGDNDEEEDERTKKWTKEPAMWMMMIHLL